MLEIVRIVLVMIVMTVFPQSPPLELEVVHEVKPESFEDWARDAGWEESLIPDVKRIATCESGLNPAATNGVMLGLMQISDAQRGWQGWWRYFGYDSSNYADPRYNLSLARKIYQYSIDRGQYGFSQWQCR